MYIKWITKLTLINVKVVFVNVSSAHTLHCTAYMYIVHMVMEPDKLLHEGSDITLEDRHAAILVYSLRHGLTKKAIHSLSFIILIHVLKLMG